MKSENWIGFVLDLLKVIGPLVLGLHGVDVTDTGELAFSVKPDAITYLSGLASAAGFYGDNKKNQKK